MRVSAGAVDHQRTVLDGKFAGALRAATRRRVLPAVAQRLGRLFLGALAPPFNAPFAFEFWLILRGVEVRIRQWQDSPCVSEKRLDQRIQFLHTFGELAGQVVLFAEIFAQIEQLPAMLSVLAAMKDADQLPIAADGR